MVLRLVSFAVFLIPFAPLTAQTHLTRQVNYTGHCQTKDMLSPCDSMTLVSDLDHGSRITVIFATCSGMVAQFPGKACKFQKKDGRIVGVECGHWKFRVGGSSD
jgi:hypothetical protein